MNDFFKREILLFIRFFLSFGYITVLFAGVLFLLIPENFSHSITDDLSRFVFLKEVLRENFFSAWGVMHYGCLLLGLGVFRKAIYQEMLSGSLSKGDRFTFIRDAMAVWIFILVVLGIIQSRCGAEEYFISPAFLSGHALAMWTLMGFYAVDKPQESLGHSLTSTLVPVAWILAGHGIRSGFTGSGFTAFIPLVTEIALIYLLAVGVSMMMTPQKDLDEFIEHLFPLAGKKWIVILIRPLIIYVTVHLITWFFLLSLLLIIIPFILIAEIVGGDVFTGTFMDRMFAGSGKLMASYFLAPILFSVLWIYEKFRMAFLTPGGWVSLVTFLAGLYSAIRLKIYSTRIEACPEKT